VEGTEKSNAYRKVQATRAAASTLIPDARRGERKKLSEILNEEK